MKRLLCFIAASLILTSQAIAQSPAVTAIDKLLMDLTAKDEFSGAVLVADSSGVLLSKGYGYADRERKVKNTPDTRFDLSAASSVFTGTAITLLAKQGKLKFTDAIDKYVPGLPNGKTITIHHVLTHSAGLNDFHEAKGFTYKGVRNCTDIMRFMKDMPPLYKPGESCSFNPGDCMVLGAVVEKITGMDFPEYCRKAFIEPLKMTNTNFVPYWKLDDSQREYSIGYRKNDRGGYTARAYNYDPEFIPLSVGGAWSSIIDLYKFDKAVFSGKLLSKKYLDQMTARYTSQWEHTNFGYVWVTSDKNGYYSIGHSGDSIDWHAINDYYPNHKYTIIILTNFGSVDQYDLEAKIEKLLFD